MLKQISVFVENQAGSLMNVTSALKDNNISIRAIASFDTPEFAILRLIVDKPEEAKEALAKLGFIVRLNEVMAIELEDKVGNLNDLLTTLATNEISINYIYSFVIRQNQAPVMVLNTDKPEEATKILEREGFQIV
ncbi:MAG: ACT domain-containing protein [Lachnospiraceae bacterium]|nr:ACT domain-containing protein [Lachnospira sp.]MBR6697033.1 ACT domain-containing protein [Lachnospiraceae bacterium]